MAAQLADYLLQIKAIKLQPTKPFVWSSGWLSPIYCDNRLTLSYPKIRTFIRQELSKVINEFYPNPDVIAGVATGGIAHGALVAQELGLPFVYVRSSPKSHGLSNSVEGHFEKGKTVVVVEDLISTGQSSLKVIQALRDAGGSIKGLVSIFDYGFEIAKDAFQKENCPYHSLSNYEHILQQAVNNKYIKQEVADELKSWRANPDKWGKSINLV